VARRRSRHLPPSAPSRRHPLGNPFPAGSAFPFVLSMNPMENAMQNLSALSRAELIGALLAPVLPTDHAHADQVNDLESAYFGTAAVVGEASDTLLEHKLGVARELLMRDLRAQLNAGPVMNSPQTLRDWLRLHCAGLQHEVFIVLFLDAQGRLLSAVEMFRGTLTQTSVYPREIVKSALQRNAAAVALAHNHPSGSPEPSRADEFLTQNLKSALALVDVRVLDHFVVAGDQCVSFAERGLM